jgi:hypothetical protein
MKKQESEFSDKENWKSQRENGDKLSAENTNI